MALGEHMQLTQSILGGADDMGRGQTKTMTSARAEADQFCPILPVVELVFSRWAPPILWVLDQHGRLRFTELERYLSPVTAKVLTLRLRQLERDGLIKRTYHHEAPPRVEYEVSELGRSLSPVFAAVGGWSGAHMPEVEAARHSYDLAEQAALGLSYCRTGATG